MGLESLSSANSNTTGKEKAGLKTPLTIKSAIFEVFELSAYQSSQGFSLIEVTCLASAILSQGVRIHVMNF